MTGRRPSLRLAVLLAYALVVHALVWATAAGAGHGRLDGAFCRSGAAPAALPLVPGTPADDCELACAVAVTMDTPSAIAVVAPRRVRGHAGPPAVAGGRDRTWGRAYPRGPPVA